MARPATKAAAKASAKASPKAAAAKAKAEAKAEPKARAKRAHRYTPEELCAASGFLRKVMEAADFNSNSDGGSAHFKSLLNEARQLAPPNKRIKLDEVERFHFKGNTPTIHKRKLDELISIWREEQVSAS